MVLSHFFFVLFLFGFFKIYLKKQTSVPSERIKLKKKKTRTDISQRLITFKLLQSLTWAKKLTPKHSLLPLSPSSPSQRAEQNLLSTIRVLQDITKSQTNSEFSRRITLLWNRAHMENTMFPPTRESTTATMK